MHKKSAQPVYKQCKLMCINIESYAHKPQLVLNFTFINKMIHIFNTALPLFLHNQNLIFTSIKINFLHNIHKTYINNYI